jgi:hypothetical protein
MGPMRLPSLPGELRKVHRGVIKGPERGESRRERPRLGLWYHDYLRTFLTVSSSSNTVPSLTAALGHDIMSRRTTLLCPFRSWHSTRSTSRFLEAYLAFYPGISPLEVGEVAEGLYPVESPYDWAFQRSFIRSSPNRASS